MSFKTLVIKHLTDNGMFENQAEQVFEEMEKDEANESMQGRWGDAECHYPDPMSAIVIMIANNAAVKWIDENLPKAWFRPMFAGQKGEKN